MNVTSSGPVGGITVFVLAASLISTVFWMVIAWRAMRAHEQLAESSKRLASSIQDFSREYRSLAGIKGTFDESSHEEKESAAMRILSEEGKVG